MTLCSCRPFIPVSALLRCGPSLHDKVCSFLCKNWPVVSSSCAFACLSVTYEARLRDERGRQKNERNPVTVFCEQLIFKAISVAWTWAPLFLSLKAFSMCNENVFNNIGNGETTMVFFEGYSYMYRGVALVRIPKADGHSWWRRIRWSLATRTRNGRGGINRRLFGFVRKQLHQQVMRNY